VVTPFIPRARKKAILEEGMIASTMVKPEADMVVKKVAHREQPWVYEVWELFGHERAVFGPNTYFGRWRIDDHMPIAEVYLDGDWVVDPKQPEDKKAEYLLVTIKRHGYSPEGLTINGWHWPTVLTHIPGGDWYSCGCYLCWGELQAELGK
jgi:hypothetical protein